MPLPIRQQMARGAAYSCVSALFSPLLFLPPVVISPADIAITICAYLFLFSLFRWALFPDSSESQARYMNRHEEALLSLADARYDWDLRIARLESCLNRLEAIGEALKRLPAMERKYCTVRPSFFGQVHIACFRRIFGANTEQVILHYLLHSPSSCRARVPELRCGI